MAEPSGHSSSSSIEIISKIKTGTIPKHIGVIMDGNGRWAALQSKPRIEGHKAGAETVNSMMDACLELEIPVVSLYAFSTENWRRPSFEIKALFDLLNLYITDKLPKMIQNGIRFIVSGDISKLPKKSQQLIEDGIEQTKKNKNLLTNFCLNYGSQDEILQAVQLLIEKRLEGFNEKDHIKDHYKKLTRKPKSKEFEKFLYTSKLPPVDLMIRTSGEHRVSNFLLYQAAYAEFYFTDVLWPDFDDVELYKSIIEFQKRDRRYGGLS